MPAKDLYAADFHAWTLHTAKLLRAGRLAEVDVARVAGEIAYRAARERQWLRRHLQVLLKQLLRWKCQPARRTPGSKAAIQVQRLDISQNLEWMPSLRRLLPEFLPKAYRRAVLNAADKTRLPQRTFPPECPFTLKQILDDNFFPVHRRRTAQNTRVSSRLTSRHVATGK